MENSSNVFNSVDTKCDDPCLMIYTSGTTGKSKGCLHGHRVLLGHLPGIETTHSLLPQLNDVFWTPADWAWIGGLLDVLMPAWYYGIPAVSYRMDKFRTYHPYIYCQKYIIHSEYIIILLYIIEMKLLH